MTALPTIKKLKDLEVELCVVLSTAHIQSTTNTWLETHNSVCNKKYDWIAPSEYGWVFTYLSAEVDYLEGMPAELIALIIRLKEHGAHMLKLDCDGPKSDDFPLWNW